MSALPPSGSASEMAAANSRSYEHRLNDFLALLSRSGNLTFARESRLESSKTEPSGLPDLRARPNESYDRKRLQKVLDALALICVSRAQGDVFAVGARLWQASGIFRTVILVACNDEVPNTTIVYLKNIWTSLREVVAELEHEHEQIETAHDHDSQVTPPDAKEIFTDLKTKVLRAVVRHTWGKLRRRLLDKRRRFDLFPFHHFKSHVNMTVLDKTLMALLGQALNTSGPANVNEVVDDLVTVADYWEDCSIDLDVQRSIAVLELETEWSQLDHYLRKVVAYPRAVTTLFQFARSPRCRGIMKGVINFTPLPAQLDLPALELPQSATQWMSSLESFAEDFNAYTDTAWEPIPHEVDVYCAKLAAKAFPSSRTVHCESRILAHFLRFANSSNVQFYSFVGVSKLSCRACQCFFEAVNTVHGTSYFTSGCHHKWYYPWRLPPIHDKGSAIAEKAYNLAITRMLPRHPAFRVKRADLHSDSEGVSSPEAAKAEGSGDKSAESESARRARKDAEGRAKLQQLSERAKRRKFAHDAHAVADPTAGDP